MKVIFLKISNYLLTVLKELRILLAERDGEC